MFHIHKYSEVKQNDVAVSVSRKDKKYNYFTNQTNGLAQFLDSFPIYFQKELNEFSFIFSGCFGTLRVLKLNLSF